MGIALWLHHQRHHHNSANFTSSANCEFIHRLVNLYARMGAGVKIHTAQNCKEVTARIELSSGTRVADASEISNPIHGDAYEEGARLPREPWRRPATEEAQRLIATEMPRDRANTVAIVSLPDELSDDYCEVIRNVSTETLEAELLRPLRTICELGEPLHCIGASANPANLKTVTINRHSGRFNGLHVDNWDGSGPEFRGTFRPIAFASTSAGLSAVFCFCRSH